MQNTDHRKAREEQRNCGDDGIVSRKVSCLQGLGCPQRRDVQLIVEYHFLIVAVRHGHRIVAGLLRPKDDYKFPVLDENSINGNFPVILPTDPDLLFFQSIHDAERYAHLKSIPGQNPAADHNQDA